MQVLLLSARVILAITLGLAGVSKLIDATEFKAAVREFGVPTWLAGPISHGLPPAEVAIALPLVRPAAAAVSAACGQSFEVYASPS